MKDKVVIITGGSSGIGKALAIKFAAEGSKVLIAARKEEQLDETQRELKAAGMDVFTFKADVSLESDCVALVNEALARFGKIDILVGNAGISMRALFENVQMDVFRKVMDVNFYGLVYSTKHALPHIIKTQGSVVGISSVNGRRAAPLRSAYSASKFAMVGFLESLRMEVMHRNVNVLTVCPGFTSSNIRRTALLANGSPQGFSPRNEEKMMSADEVANQIYRAVKSRKRDLLLTTEGKLAVWLNYFFPRWMDTKMFEFIAKEDNHKG